MVFRSIRRSRGCVARRVRATPARCPAESRPPPTISAQNVEALDLAVARCDDEVASVRQRRSTQPMSPSGNEARGFLPEIGGAGCLPGI